MARTPSAAVTHALLALDHEALIVTKPPVNPDRVLFDIGEANKYKVFESGGTQVAQIHEDKQDLLHEIGKQLLGNQRRFRASVLSADGSQVIFRLYRPAYLINSTMYIQDSTGTNIGEIHQRFHPVKRKYDILIGGHHFATIKGNFFSWKFPLKDPQTGDILALIDRNFLGFGKELFTDAGKYAIHFGVPIKQTPSSDELAVARPLTIEERMAVLAAAISIDYDHFSQHTETAYVGM